MSLRRVARDKPLTASRGTLKSLNYPGSFPPNTNSVWQITVADGFLVILRILELLIPGKIGPKQFLPFWIKASISFLLESHEIR